MGKSTKTADELDGMIEHIRYEVMHVIGFLQWGNGWCAVLHPQLAQLTRESLLEAALLHFRALIEFLGNKPEERRVVAREYLDAWNWKINANVSKVENVHGRVAHLGVVRLPVAKDGAFKWDTWLSQEAPAVLAGFRRFLAQLQIEAPARYALFLQPGDELPYIDLLGVLDSVPGVKDAATA
jgi:hypothetical protein